MAMPTLPRRRTMMWVALLAIAAMVALAVLVGVRQGALCLAGALVVLAGIRMLSPAPGPYGITVRSRAFDTVILLAGAGAITSLVLTIPLGSI